jgi:hypothetical protein
MQSKFFILLNVHNLAEATTVFIVECAEVFPSNLTGIGLVIYRWRKCD